MATGARRFFQSPLRVILVLHGLCALATLALLAGALVTARNASSAGSAAAASGNTNLLVTIGNAVQTVSTGAGGLTLFWVAIIPLAALLVVSLVTGLVFGKWGLPGYLQGRAVFFVPFLAPLYFAIGWFVFGAIQADGFKAAWAATQGLFTTSAGLTLLLLYAALSTAAVGLGWAVSLAIANRMRSRGKWETIGYVEQA